MLKETLQERLQWFHPEHYQESTKKLTIRETNEEGKADVDCMVNGYAISFSFEPQWKILKNKRCADGIIFEQVGPQTWKLHIVECNRTVGKKSWDKKIKKQFEGALLHANALKGLLGIQNITAIKCYTAYQKDNLSPENSTDTVFFKTPVGQQIKDSSILEWMNDRINLLSLKDVEHQKIQLDEQGKGKVRL